MIDRLAYGAVCVALAAVMLFDPNFAANLSRAFGGSLAADSLVLWEASLCAGFAALAIVALLKERRR